MIDQHRSVRGHGRSPLLERPGQQRRPLLSSNAARGDAISLTARSCPFVNAPPVQQPFIVSSSAASVDTLSSRGPHLGNGNRRKGLLNTPTKPESQPVEKKPSDEQEAMCVSCKSKLRLNERGEYCCSSCGKIQVRSAVSISSLIGPPLVRQRTGSVEPDDLMAHRTNGDNGPVRKLPALLDLPSSMYPMGPQSSPMPLISFPNNVGAFVPTTSAPTSLFALMTPNHRLYPSDDKPQSLFATSLSRSNNGAMSKKQSKPSDRSSTRHQPYPRADYVRGADLKLPNSPNKNGRSSLNSKRDRRTDSRGTVTDARQETDLAWLCQQRASIDRRIAQLQGTGTSGAEADVQGLESVTYISGYYCHVCRKFLRGDYKAKIVHCRDQSHVTNFANKDDSGNQDADSLFKYYEEKYEIAFDGDDDGPLTDQSGSVTESASSHHDHSDSTRQDSMADESMEESDAFHGDANGAEPDSEDDEAEASSHRERFDRTKISR